MNIREIIEYADTIVPNNYGNALKYQWINDVDDCIQNKILGIRSEARRKYVCSTNGQGDAATSPIAESSFGHEIYTDYICAMLSFAIGDAKAYNAAYKNFNNQLSEIAKSYISSYNRRTRDVIAAYTDNCLLELFGDAIISGRLKIKNEKSCIHAFDGETHLFDIVRYGSSYSVTSPDHAFNITGTPFLLAVNGENCQISCTVSRFGQVLTFTENHTVFLGDMISWTATANGHHVMTGETSGTLYITGNTVLNKVAEPVAYNFTHSLNDVSLAYATPLRHGCRFTAVITPDEGYSLPSAVIITIGGVSANDYTYDAETGTVSIDGENITGDLYLVAYGMESVSATPPLTSGNSEEG